MNSTITLRVDVLATVLFGPYPWRWVWIGKQPMIFLQMRDIKWAICHHLIQSGVRYLGSMGFIGQRYQTLALIAIQLSTLRTIIPKELLFSASVVTLLRFVMASYMTVGIAEVKYRNSIGI